MRSRWREALLLTAAAAWGVAAAITIATLFIGDARPDQLPGNMAARNLDARGPLRGIEVLAVVPILAALVARKPLRRIAEDAQPWAVVAVATALAAGLWLALADPFDSITILLVPPIAAAVFSALRKRALNFTTQDVLLLPLAIAILVILAQWTTLSFARLTLISTALVIAWRLIDPRPRPREGLIAYGIYPLFAIAFVALFRPATPPVVNLFEDGHSLLPASQMLRGGRPYVDFVPGHGLLSDGVIDFVAMKLGASDVTAVLRVRRVIDAFVPAAIYFAALGVTGSPEAAILALLLSASMTITGTPWAKPVSALGALPRVRPLPSLLSLAAAAAAVRLQSRRWLIAAAALAILSYFTSVEFGVYAVIATAVASVLMRDLRTFAIAIAASAAVPLLALLVLGALPAFLHFTLIDTPPLVDAYAIGFFAFPAQFAHLQGIPEIIGGLFAPPTVWFVMWFAVLIGTATAIAIRPARGGAAIVAGCWTIAAALSFAERTNVYFLPVALITAVAWARKTPLAIALLIAMATPTAELARIVDAVRHPPREAGVPFRNALVRPDTLPRLQAAQDFLVHSLRPGDTFVDFANMPILYSLFDIRDPLRQPETPFYETEPLQREVIARLESDRSVRAALVQYPNEGVVTIDGVPNAIRAPLVFAYLQTHFQPAYAKNGVVFWLRR